MFRTWFISNIDTLQCKYKYLANIKKNYCILYKYEVTEEIYYIFVLFCMKMFVCIRKIRNIELNKNYRTFSKLISTTWSRNTIDGIYNYELLDNKNLYMDGLLNDEIDFTKLFLLNSWDHVIVFCTSKNSSDLMLAACRLRYRRLFIDTTRLIGSATLKNKKHESVYTKKPVRVYKKRNFSILSEFASVCIKESKKKIN